jgi:hypothetical protein
MNTGLGMPQVPLANILLTAITLTGLRWQDGQAPPGCAGTSEHRLPAARWNIEPVIADAGGTSSRGCIRGPLPRSCGQRDRSNLTFWVRT